MHTPTPRFEPVESRVFGRTGAALLGASVAACAVLVGCASNDASGPMKPSPASASKPMAPAAAPKTSTPAKPAPSTAAASKPAPTAVRREVQAAPKPAAASSRSPAAPSAPAAKPAAPVVTKSEAPTTPTRITTAPKSSDAQPVPAPSAATTADFSTGLLFPDPDPATAGTRTVSLCEFKNGVWTPIMSAPVQTYGGDARGVTFRAVPVGRMVLPAYIVGEEVRPAANPWAVETSGKVRELKGPCATCPGNEPPILTLELRPAATGTTNQRMAVEASEYGVIGVRAERNRRYTLSYWDGAWKAIGEATVSGDEPVRIEGVPSRRVLWLQSEGESLTLPVLP